MKLGIFVSSPGDVNDERVVARQVIERLRGEFSGRAEIETLFWEDEPLLSTGTFQQQIPRASSYEIVVCVLCSRLGTPITGPDGNRYNSGTEFEFLDAWNSFRDKGSPDLLIYKSTKARQPEFRSVDDARDWFQQNEMLGAFIDQRLKNPDGTFKAAFHTFGALAQFEEKLETHLRKLILKRLPEGGSRSLPEVIIWPDRSPFRGLLPFDADHAPVFFGRTAAISGIKEVLLQRAQAGCAFVLVTGMSGCGKSSVLQAGLLPLLMQPGIVPGVDVWRTCRFRPAQTPGDLFGGLSRSLLEPGALPELSTAGFDAAQLAALLRDAPEHAVPPTTGALRQAAAGLTKQAIVAHEPTARLVLLVDQLEELFTSEGIDAQERDNFVKLLVALARSGDVWVLATLRSDFFHRLAELPELSSLPQTGGHYHLVPPTPTEIGQMIRYPARAAGLMFERRQATGERLDHVLQQAAEQDAQALPLLEFVLDELYSACSPKRLLTFEAYGRLGGLEGALAQRAEEVLTKLAAPVQAELPAVLRALVTLESDGRETAAAARVPLERLKSPPSRAALVQALTDARLLTTDQGEDGRPVVRLVHEALLRHWPRLQKWLGDDREFLRVRTRVAEASRRWESESKHADLLLPEGKPLAEAVDILEQRRAEIEPALLNYVEASRRKVRSRRNRRRTIVSATTALVFALVAGFAVHSWIQAGRLRAALVQADEAKNDAVRSERAAISEKEEAERQRAIAQKQSALAEGETKRAEAQKALAEAQTARAEAQTRVADEQKALAQERQKLTETQRGLALDFADKSQLLLGEQAAFDSAKEGVYTDIVDRARHLADELLKLRKDDRAVRHFKMYLLASALDSRLRLEQYQNAYEDSQQALALAEGLLADDLDPESLRRTVGAIASAAHLFKELGENDKAQKAAELAVASVEKLDAAAGAPVVEVVCAAWSALGEVKAARGQPAEARTAFQKSLDIAQAALAEHKDDDELKEAVAAAWIRVGKQDRVMDALQDSATEIRNGKDLRIEIWRRPAAKGLYKEAALRRKLAEAFQELGYTQKSLRDWKGARESFQNVFNVHESLAKFFKHNESQFPVAEAEVRLAELERDRGQPQDAATHFDRALKTLHSILETNWQRKHRRFAATTHVTFGDLHEDFLDDWPAALDHYRQALKLRELILDANSDTISRYDVADMHRMLARLEASRLEWAAARPEAEQSVMRFRELVKDRPTTKNRQGLATALDLLAQTHRGEGRFDEARQAYAEVTGIYETLSGESSAASPQLDLAVACKEQARLELDAGRPAEALAAFDKALDSAAELVKRQSTIFNDSYRAVLLAGRAAAELRLDRTADADRDFAESQKIFDELENRSQKRNDRLDLAGRCGSLLSILPDGVAMPMAVAASERRISILRALAKDASDILAQRRLTSALGSAAWLELLDKRPQKAIDLAREALSRDPKQLWIAVNLAHGLMFTGDTAGAVAICDDLRARPVRGQTFAWWVLDDYRRLRAANITHPDFSKIEALVQPATAPAPQ